MCDVHRALAAPCSHVFGRKIAQLAKSVDFYRTLAGLALPAGADARIEEGRYLPLKAQPLPPTNKGSLPTPTLLP